MAQAHIVFSGLFFLAAICIRCIYKYLLMNVQQNCFLIFRIHLFLLGVAFFGDAFHVRGLYGPRIRVPDSYGLTGRVQYVNLAWGVEGFDLFVPRGVASHHIAASKDLGHIGRSIPSY